MTKLASHTSISPFPCCDGVREDIWKVTNLPKVISIKGDRVKVHTWVHAIPHSVVFDNIPHCLGRQGTEKKQKTKTAFLITEPFHSAL